MEQEKDSSDSHKRIPLLFGTPAKPRQEVCFSVSCKNPAKTTLKHMERAIINPNFQVLSCNRCNKRLARSLRQHGDDINFPPFLVCSICAGLNEGQSVSLFANGVAVVWICSVCEKRQAPVLQANLFLLQKHVSNIKSANFELLPPKPPKVQSKFMPDQEASAYFGTGTRKSSLSENPTKKRRRYTFRSEEESTDTYLPPRPSSMRREARNHSSSRELQTMSSLEQFDRLLQNHKRMNDLMGELLLVQEEQRQIILELSDVVMQNQGDIRDELSSLPYNERNSILKRIQELKK